MITTAEERAAILEAVRRLMADKSAEADVRRVMETSAGYDAAVWQELAAMGITGLLIPPEYGGVGLSAVELELLMEETGAALFCSPLLSSGVLAAGILMAVADDDTNRRLLPGIASGEVLATVAMTGDAGTWTPEGVTATAQETANGWSLDGVASFVTHGQIAHLLLVVARTRTGFGIFELAPNAPGLTVGALPTFDRTLRLARMEFLQTPAVQIGGAGWETVERAIDLGLVALAGEQAGGARRIFEMTVEYAKTRIQFGRAIGSFQAIKHMAADLLLESESALSAARHAAQDLAENAETASAAVSLAAFTCADAFSTIAAAAIQMHGGIGFTWEHPAHLYLRRARAQAQFLGTSQFHRERYLAELGA